MPPANQVEAVCLHNTQEWPSGRWVPMRFELDSWVTLNPDPDSDWGRDSCRYHRDSQQYLWKAQVKGFELGCDGILISRVKVRHAYEPRQLSLDPDLARPRIHAIVSITLCFQIVVVIPPTLLQHLSLY